MTIKQFRKLKGWRQCDLAEKIDVTDRIVRMWETGTINPHKSTKERLKAIGYDWDDNSEVNK